MYRNNNAKTSFWSELHIHAVSSCAVTTIKEIFRSHCPPSLTGRESLCTVVLFAGASSISTRFSWPLGRRSVIVDSSVSLAQKPRGLRMQHANFPITGNLEFQSFSIGLNLSFLHFETSETAQLNSWRVCHRHLCLQHPEMRSNEILLLFQSTSVGFANLFYFLKCLRASTCHSF